jgi:hypothetical protein
MHGHGALATSTGSRVIDRGAEEALQRGRRAPLRQRGLRLRLVEQPLGDHGALRGADGRSGRIRVEAEEHAWARAAVEGRSAATSGRSGATYVCTPVRGVTVSAVAVGGRGGGVGEASTPCG